LTGLRPRAKDKIVLTGDYTPRALPRLSQQEQEIIAYVELGGTLAIASYAVGMLSVQAEHMRESNSRFRAALRVAEQEAVEKYGKPKSEVAQYFMTPPIAHGGEAGPERIRFWIRATEAVPSRPSLEAPNN
jgi:hypothetical protein